MKLKVDENEQAVFVDGKPVYIGEDDKEVPVDVPGLFQKVAELNAEAKAHRIKAKELKERLDLFGELDPEESRQAVETVKSLDQKKLLDAGQVEAVQKQIAEGYEAKLAKKDKDLAAKDDQIRTLLVSNRFASSPVMNRLTLTPDIAEAYFGRFFRVEPGDDGRPRVVGVLDDVPIMSAENPTRFADFDEALDRIIDRYPRRDEILKASGTKGSGSSSGMDLKDVDPGKMTDSQKAAFIGKHGLEAWQGLVDSRRATPK